LSHKVKASAIIGDDGLNCLRWAWIAPQTVDSQWAAQVERHSIAKLGARIPPI